MLVGGSDRYAIVSVSMRSQNALKDTMASMGRMMAEMVDTGDGGAKLLLRLCVRI